jgi:hypothetical protein
VNLRQLLEEDVDLSWMSGTAAIWSPSEGRKLAQKAQNWSGWFLGAFVPVNFSALEPYQKLHLQVGSNDAEIESKIHKKPDEELETQWPNSSPLRMI